MLSGVKFIPRDQVNKAQDENLDASIKEKKKLSSRKEKHRRKKKRSRYSSSDDEEIEIIKKGSRKNKKWYSSDEYSSSAESESESSSDLDEKKLGNKKKNKRTNDDRSGDETRDRSKKRSRSGGNQYSSEDHSLSTSEDEDGGERGSRKRGRKKSKGRRVKNDIAGDDLADDDGRESHSLNDMDFVRKEMGLEWMLRPQETTDTNATIPNEPQPEEPQTEEITKVNRNELNPYLKDNGSGYPEDTDGTKAGGNQLLTSSVIGDGGASWRLKALKRAQEQAAREGRKLDEVVEERWGSLGQLAVSVASRAPASSHAHLHAIKNRKRGVTEERETVDQNTRDTKKKGGGRDYLKDVSLRHPDMKAPKVRDSLSWGRRKGQNMSAEDVGLVSAAVSSLNKFANDGSFMREAIRPQNNDPGGSTNCEENVGSELISSDKPSEEIAVVKQALSANQLAAKALQLRMKGKHEEAEKLLKEAENIKVKQGAEDKLIRQRNEGSTSRYVMQDISVKKKKEEDADIHLAQKIVQNKQYSTYGQADDEYDFDDGPSRKSRKKGGSNEHKLIDRNNFSKRILTQQERCQFCFENPTRPKHLVVSIANFTYLMLPQWEPVVPGHCCILPMQHESATRTVDNNVWDEIRNFKKCLIMMFTKQEKDLVFLETVMGLAQQRRHCLIECIPLPCEIAKQAPLYFKKAIDEAEDEWSQHNAKKLIDTSVKGLRGSVPKDFPYFHVEFGLNKGFVHVIDDETQFKSSLGLNVIRGMLQLSEENMYRRRRHESMEAQKQAVVSFVQDWEPFDWTKQLD